MRHIRFRNSVIFRFFPNVAFRPPGFLLCYFLAKQESGWHTLMKSGSNITMVDIPHHPWLCQELSLHRNKSSSPTQLNGNWFYFLIFDLVTVLLFARCLSKSYESIVRIKKQVKMKIFSFLLACCPTFLQQRLIRSATAQK